LSIKEKRIFCPCAIDAGNIHLVYYIKEELDRINRIHHVNPVKRRTENG